MTSVSYSPVFRTYSALRYSLANPTLYFYRNKRYRKALLQLIGLEKIQEIEWIDPKGRWARRNLVTVELVDTEGARSLKRSHSFPEQTLVCKFWLVIFKCHECVFIGCSVYSVVDSQFRRDVLVFFMDCLCCLRQCFLVGFRDADRCMSRAQVCRGWLFCQRRLVAWVNFWCGRCLQRLSSTTHRKDRAVFT